MIQLVRIDDRLLHGQVAYSWKAHLGYQAIVIANDEAAGDNFRKQALKMAAPAGTQVTTRTVESAIQLLHNPKLENVKVLVVVGNPKDALAIVRSCEEYPTVNLGGMMNGEGRKEFAKAVYVREEDVKALDEMQDLGVVIETQQLPTEPVQKYETLRARYEV